MPKYVKYRGAKQVPVTVVRHVKKHGKDMVELMPRSDWINPGEKLPIVRSPDKIYTTSKPIPRRKK